ncbi:hypothetical protein HDE_13166 [Halotydeus destructor]|nr:hypothetical protein HDE_13166 [Halotydeus destructor]
MIATPPFKLKSRLPKSARKLTLHSNQVKMRTFSLICLIAAINCASSAFDLLNCQLERTAEPEAIVSVSNEIRIFSKNVTITAKNTFNYSPQLISQKKSTDSFKRKLQAVYADSESTVSLLTTRNICQCPWNAGRCTLWEPLASTIPSITTSDRILTAGGLDKHGDRILVTYNSSNQATQIVYDKTTKSVVSTVQLPSVKVAPSLISFVKSSGANSVTLLVCQGKLCGYHEVNPNALQPIVMDKKVNYFWSRVWLGCAAEICFDCSLDGALRFTNKDIKLFKGRWSFSYDKFSKGIDFSSQPYGDDARFPDGQFEGAFSTRTTHAVPLYYYFQGDNVYAVPSNRKSSDPVTPKARISSTFPGLSGPVDAAYSDDSGTAFILQGTSVHEFSFANGAWKKVVDSAFHSKWPGLPADIEAAVNVDGVIYFFKNNFYYELIKSAILEPKLVQGNLFDCNDRDITKYVGGVLNITNIKQLQDYREQFKARPAAEPSTGSTGSPGATGSSESGGETGSPVTVANSPTPSRSSVGPIVGMTIAFLLVLSCLAYGISSYLKKKGSKPSRGQAKFPVFKPAEKSKVDSDAGSETGESETDASQAPSGVQSSAASEAKSNVSMVPKRKGVVSIAESQAPSGVQGSGFSEAKSNVSMVPAKKGVVSIAQSQVSAVSNIEPQKKSVLDISPEEE